MKIAAQSYNEVGSLSDLKHQITVKTEAGKSAKQSAVKLEHRMKDLAEIIKYAEQYKTNRSYHIAYKKSKNPDAYFRRYEIQLILYGGARRVLEQAGINYMTAFPLLPVTFLFCCTKAESLTLSRFLRHKPCLNFRPLPSNV